MENSLVLAHRITHKLVIKIIILFFGIGSGIGFLLAPSLPGILLQPDVNNIDVINTYLSESFFVKVVFSFLVAVSFASAPFSALIACKFSSYDRYPFWILLFILVMFAATIAAIIHYRNYFSEMSAAINIEKNISISMDKLPFFEIPIIGTCASVAMGLLAMGLRHIKKDT